MKSIFDMSVLDFTVKTGNINVNASELRHMLYMVERYHSIIENEQNIDEDNFINNYKSYMEYFQNKYLVLGELRVKEKSAFDFMKTIEESMKLFSGQDYINASNLYKELKDEYLKYKFQRKELQESIEKIKNEKYAMLV